MCRKTYSSISRAEIIWKLGMFCIIKPFLRIFIQITSVQIDATLMNEPHFLTFTKAALGRPLLGPHAQQYQFLETDDNDNYISLKIIPELRHSSPIQNVLSLS